MMLGWMHEVGRGVPKDLGEAARWFRLAAARGNSVARDHLRYIETLRVISPAAPPLSLE